MYAAAAADWMILYPTLSFVFGFLTCYLSYAKPLDRLHKSYIEKLERRLKERE